mgnify:FL=1
MCNTRVRGVPRGKGPFGTLLGPCLFWGQCSGLFEADLKCSLGLPELRDKSQFV